VRILFVHRPAKYLCRPLHSCDRRVNSRYRVPSAIRIAGPWRSPERRQGSRCQTVSATCHGRRGHRSIRPCWPAGKSRRRLLARRPRAQPRHRSPLVRTRHRYRCRRFRFVPTHRHRLPRRCRSAPTHRRCLHRCRRFAPTRRRGLHCCRRFAPIHRRCSWPPNCRLSRPDFRRRPRRRKQSAPRPRATHPPV